MRAGLAIAIVLAIAGVAHAEPTVGRYFERGRWHVASESADGALVIEREDGTRFDAAIGTERVIVSGLGAIDPGSIGVVVDEVLSARADIVAVRSSRGESTFALAERLGPLVANGTLRAAMPDLALAHHLANIHVPPNDPLYSSQWFYQTLHIEDAWRHEDGDPSVTIAVVDDGCDLTHPDLLPHLLPGYDAINDTPTPTYTPMTAGNNHGTSCAGLAAGATDNGTDVAGTCAECSLRCVRLLGADGALIPTSDDVRAYDFVLMHADVAVVSNSWGFTQSVPAPQALVDVINMVQTQGHGGLGAVVVFAAGNDGRVISGDELQAIPGLVTVGAINQFLEATSFTNTGDCIAIVAPAGTVTLDIVGPEGADPGETTTGFGGTSSACPIVAGVLGLMASRRPMMTAMDLRAALIATTRPAPFATPDAMGHDLTYGYGVVDPAAALARIDPNGVPDAGPADGGAIDAGAVAPPPSSGCGCSVAHRSTPLWLLGVLALVLARRRSIALAILLAGCASSPDVVASAPAYLRPTLTESIVSPGGAFRIHFTRTGTDSVPLADVDGNGTPDFVDYVAQQYDMVLTRYMAMGFHAPLSDTSVTPDNGGGAEFDVYLAQVGGGGESDGEFVREQCSSAGCVGYMLEANTFSTAVYPSWQYGARLVAAHELFHAVQAAYADAISAQGSTLSESTAVWASYQYDPSLRDLMDFGAAFLMRPDRALEVDPIGPVQPYAYGAAVVWEFYSTHYEPALVVHFWDTLAITTSATASNWLDVLDTVLVHDHNVGFRASYADLAEWLMFTGPRFDAMRGPPSGQLYTEVAATSVTTLPYTTVSTRIFPASAHYFLVSGDHVSVRLTNGDPSGIDVIAVAFNGNSFVQDARGVGQVDLRAAGADSVLVALANGARSGTSDAVSICIAGLASDCASTTDAGVADASMSDAATVAPMPAASCGCRAARSGHGWALAGVALVACLRRRRSRRR